MAMTGSDSCPLQDSLSGFGASVALRSSMPSDSMPGLHDVTSAEEQLLRMEMTELQRSLSEAHGEASGARETADQVMNSLQEAQALHKREVQELSEAVEMLQHDLAEEKLRANNAERRRHDLQSELDLRAVPAAEPSGDKQQTQGGSGDDNSSALWQELDAARGDAATSKACAAEARATAESAAAQLEQLRSSHSGFLQDIQRVLCGTDDPQNDASCQGILIQIERVLQHRSAVEDRLSETRQKLVEEQEAVVQLREDNERQRRATQSAQLAAEAKDQQLDHWKSRAGRANVPCNSTESSAQNVPDDGMSATADSHPSVPAVTTDNRASGSVTDIVSKWRSVSLKQIHETHSLADQLSVERKAVHSLRSQALMLERQLETSEDQLENERTSAAAREATIRTQLSNLEAQVAEQEGLLKLRASGVAAAESHAESVTAELLGARERVQTLEDMVKATETELQSAINQISEMQNVVLATDIKLCDAQNVSADRDAAVQHLTSCIATVHRIMRKPDAPDHHMDDEHSAEHAAKQLTSLLTVVEQECSRRLAGIDKLSAQCQALEEQVEARNVSAQDVKGQLREVTEKLVQRTAELVKVKGELEDANAGLQKWQKDAHQSAAQVASASANSSSLAAELEKRDQQVAVLKVAADTEAMSAQHLSGKLDARCEEVSSLQSQLQTAQDMARRLQDQLSQADSEIRSLQVAAAGASESQAGAQRDADGLRAHSQSLASRLEDSESRLASMQESLDKRQQEVRELNSMLKAWEAMRLSKDAQIAALMERCKRYDEDIAEKGRSNEALRRKLMHHHHASCSAKGSVSGAGSERNASRHSIAGSVAGSLSGSDAGRVRHIHLHMHPGGGSSSAAGTPVDQSLSAEHYGNTGALAPRVARSADLGGYSGGPTYSGGHGSRIDQRHSRRPR